MTADTYVRMQQRILVARSREQFANNDYAKNSVACAARTSSALA